MDIRLQFIITVFFNFLRYGSPQKSCGELTVRWYGTTCSIQFNPSAEMIVTVRDRLQYRWLQYYPTDKEDSALKFKKVILQKNAPTPDFDTTKYNEENFTLSIYNVGKSDEGVYQVQCFTDNNNFGESTQVEIRVPLTSPTSTTSVPPKDNSATGTSTPSIDTAVIVTIAICSLVIVVIVSATVCIVVRRKQTQTEGIKRLVSRDPSSEPRHRERVVESACNIYNEIDVDNECMAAAKVHSTPHIGTKPTLPRRSEKQQSDSVYDLIADETSSQKDTDNEPTKPNDNDDIPVYAKVIKNRKHGNQQYIDDNEAGYVIMFPKINYSEVAVSLGKDYEEMAYPTVELRPAYVNSVSRSQRMKSRKMRNSSRKELQYAILDHPDSDSDSIIHIAKEEEERKIRPCQYALIDFNKKAFIAPIRKAPSSWYKRKNKKTTNKS